MIKLYHTALFVAFFLSILSPGYPTLADTTNRETTVKLAVDEDGMYRVTYFDLLDCGLNPADINPNRMYLTNRKHVVPLYFFGKDQNTWHKTDYFDFYGTANRDTTGKLDIYSDTNIYYLHWAENTILGKRYSITTTFLSGLPALESNQNQSYRVRIHREEISEQSRSQDIIDAEQGNWYWHGLTAPENFSISFNLPGQKMDMQLYCSIRIKFYGISHLNTDTDHYVVIAINQNYIGEARWDGETAYTFNCDSVPIYYFQKGSNILDILMPGAQGDPQGIAPEIDVVNLSWFEIDYWSEYRAENDYITYYYGSDSIYLGIESTLSITDFSNENISIYDITGYTKIIPLITATENAVGDTSFSAFYTVYPTLPRHDYIALTDERIKTPVRIEKKQIGQWQDPSLGADYIIITHSAFYHVLLSLADWRKSQGLRVQLINVEDIYDEFNQGIIHPQAIKDFLEYAYINWKPPHPKYVLLVGDASWDIKNNFNLDYGRTFVPVYFYSSFAGYAACDNWYVCLENGDNTPELAIGRIPAHSLTEVTNVVNKIIEYEQNQEYGPWRQSILLLATPREWTERVNDILIKNIFPKQFNPIPKYATPATTRTFLVGPQNVIESINQGQFMVHYAGHASPFNWDVGRPGEEGAPETVGYKDRGFFGIRHIPRLHNRGKYPLVISMTCYANQFDSMWSDGIGEAFIKAQESGAIACIGGTYRVSQSSFEVFDQSFLKQLFASNRIRLGDAFLAAKKEVVNDEVNNLYTLLGDPGLLISTPEPIEFNAQRDATTNLQSELIKVDGLCPLSSKSIFQGIVQIQTQKGDIITSATISNNKKGWETQFVISSTYRKGPIVVTVNLWNKTDKVFVSGRKILSPLTQNFNELETSNVINNKGVQ